MLKIWFEGVNPIWEPLIEPRLIAVRVDSDIYEGNWIVITSLDTRLVLIVNWSTASLTEFTVVEVGKNWTSESEAAVKSATEA